MLRGTTIMNLPLSRTVILGNTLNFINPAPSNWLDFPGLTHFPDQTWASVSLILTFLYNLNCIVMICKAWPLLNPMQPVTTHICCPKWPLSLGMSKSTNSTTPHACCLQPLILHLLRRGWVNIPRPSLQCESIKTQMLMGHLLQVHPAWKSLASPLSHQTQLLLLAAPVLNLLLEPVPLSKIIIEEESASTGATQDLVGGSIHFSSNASLEHHKSRHHHRH